VAHVRVPAPLVLVPAAAEYPSEQVGVCAIIAGASSNAATPEAVIEGGRPMSQTIVIVVLSALSVLATITFPSTAAALLTYSIEFTETGEQLCAGGTADFSVRCEQFGGSENIGFGAVIIADSPPDSTAISPIAFAAHFTVFQAFITPCTLPLWFPGGGVPFDVENRERSFRLSPPS
jgi:hypothetical protein